MTRLRISATLVLALLSACRHSQCGQFAYSSYTFWTLGQQTGVLSVIQGSPLSSCRIVGPERPVLHLLLVVSGMRSARFGIGGNIDTYDSLLEYSWRSKGRVATIQGKWDRREDTMSFGSATYDRARGNTFVVILERDGQVKSWQLPDAPAVNEERLLEFIKRGMRGNPIVESVALPELSQ